MQTLTGQPVRREAPPPADEPKISSCLPDELLFAFATGSLDEAERARAEAHVADCPECRAVLAEAALDQGETDPSDSALFSKSVGRYRLLALLGAGAAGVVYRAFDPELERVVALKILVNSAEDSGQGPKEHILREARAMAQLSHPNVVTVFDVGLADESVFIVMDYAPGTTLEKWLQAAERSQAEIVAAFSAAGRGLEAAHAKRLVHRDFKPENVLVSSDGQVKVTDFGLARSLGRAERGVLTGLRGGDVTTRTRGVFGTPAYMAPELFDGAPANASSDQFSFCVALLGALLGRHPFGADGGVRASELISRMREARIDFSGKRLPPALKELILRGLCAEPSERFSDMTALLAALERARGQSARPRRRLVAALAGFALVVLLLALPYVSQKSANAPVLAGNPARELAAKASLLASTLRARAPSVTGDHPAELAGVPAKSHSSAARDIKPQKRSKPAEAERYNDSLRDPF